MSHWQVPLTGKLLCTRPLRAEDFEALYAAASDPLIWEQHPDRERYKRDVFQKYFDSGLAAARAGGTHVIEEIHSRAIIGSSRFADYSPENSTVEIGYTFLTRPYWGQGHNRELKTLMLRQAFELVETALFFVGESNFRSQSAMLKIGAERIGLREKSVIFRVCRTQFAAKISE